MPLSSPREFRRLFALCSLVLVVPAASFAQVADGTVRSYFTPPNTTPSIRSAVMDASGKVVAISTSAATGAFRLNLDGTRDTGFATVGYNNTLNSVLIQSDGRILVGGMFTLTNSVFRPYITRLNTDGTVDTTFPTDIGGTGVEVLAPGSGGKFYAGKVNGYGLQRYDANGVIDSTFLSTTIGSGEINGKVLAVRELADGKVMVAHQIVTGNFATVSQKLDRLTSTGAIDPTFTAPVPNAPVHGFDILPDGRVAIIGEFTTLDAVSRVRVALLQAGGSLDTSFAPSSGMTFFGGSPHFGVKFLDNRLYVHGDITTVNGAALKGLARLNLDGSTDSTFAIGTGTDAKVYSLMLAANGDLLVAGTFTTFNSQPCYRAAYLARNDGVVTDPFAAYLIAAGVPADRRGASDDADNDGISNLMEYALDLQPMTPDAAGLPKVDKGTLLTLTYRHAHEDVTYTVETSPDLDSDSAWTTTGVNQGTSAPDGTTTASVAPDGPHRFLRLSVSR
ncbi:MAG: delta-60 repeat domain-containing protein [Verrucomicrobiota bacterium]